MLHIHSLSVSANSVIEPYKICVSNFISKTFTEVCSFGIFFWVESNAACTLVC